VLISDTPLPLVGPGVAMRALAARADELRRDVTRPVLLVGARGLGKRYLAERIHLASSLSASALLTLDARDASDAMVRTLLDEAPVGSVLLVRHIDRLSTPAQALLDQRSGDRGPIARLMATTTGDIIARVTAGAFLESLYYRLHAWPMLVPALMDRDADDLAALANAVLVQTADADAQLPTTLSADALVLLRQHTWPDNLRELEATLALAQLRARHAGAIDVAHLSMPTVDATMPAANATLADLERWHLLRALALFKGNRTHAARSLGISRMTLIAKLKLVDTAAVS
jgi:DNA-binding NtrC family response regulator